MIERYFLYAGNAYPHKNLDRLIEAVVLLNRDSKEKVILKMTSARNVFIDRLKKFIAQLEAGKYVKLLGYVPDKKLSQLYKNSIAFVFPSLSEGFGLPGLEAMNAGTLVLASDIPVFKEVYEDNVIYFDPYDVRSIEIALEQALDLSETDRKKRIEKAKQFAKRYSWAKMAKETLEIYVQAGRARLRQGK